MPDLDPPPPTLLQILQSYQRTLIALVQLEEFQGWAGTVEFFRHQVSEHQDLQRRYVVEVLRRRRESDRAAKDEGQ